MSDSWAEKVLEGALPIFMAKLRLHKRISTLRDALIIAISRGHLTETLRLRQRIAALEEQFGI